MKRTLGRSGIEVSAIGLGCWAIGGPHARNGNPVGWGAVNDAESIATLAVYEKHNLASILRGPLGMGMLSGKFTADTRLPDEDIRRGWNFKEGGQADAMQKVESLRGVLTEGGRTLAQGALCWLLARSPNMIPIPGFKTVAQVEDDLGAMNFGPLTPTQMAEVDHILGRTRP